MEPTEENRRAWDRLQHARLESTSDPRGIPDPIRELLPDLRGKHVLHELCGSGEASAELAALGALVTAIEVWEPPLASARERFPDVLFMHADPHALPVNLRRRRFDLVLAGGLLPYVHDLDAWASEAASALREGGTLLLYDLHPVLRLPRPDNAALAKRLLRWRRRRRRPAGPTNVRPALAARGGCERRHRRGLRPPPAGGAPRPLARAPQRPPRPRRVRPARREAARVLRVLAPTAQAARRAARSARSYRPQSAPPAWGSRASGAASTRTTAHRRERRPGGGVPPARAPARARHARRAGTGARTPPGEACGVESASGSRRSATRRASRRRRTRLPGAGR